MSKYLVKIKISFGGKSKTFYQYYIVDGPKLFLLQKLDLDEEGACCGQSRCIFCKMGGGTGKYVSHMEINSQNAVMANYICENQIFSIDYLLDYVPSDSIFETICDLSEAIPEDNIKIFFYITSKDNFLELWKVYDNFDDMFEKIIEFYSFNLLKEVLDILKNKMGEKKFNKFIKNENKEEAYIIYYVYRKCGIFETLKIIKKYYDDNIMFLQWSSIMDDMVEPEIGIVKKKLKNYPNIKLFLSERECKLVEKMK